MPAPTEAHGWEWLSWICHVVPYHGWSKGPPETVTLKSVNNIAKGSIIPIAESLTCFPTQEMLKTVEKKENKNLLKTHFKSWVDCWVAHCEVPRGPHHRSCVLTSFLSPSWPCLHWFHSCFPLFPFSMLTLCRLGAHHLKDVTASTNGRCPVQFKQPKRHTRLPRTTWLIYKKFTPSHSS